MFPDFPELQSDAAVLSELLASQYWQVLSKYYAAMLESKRDAVVASNRDSFEYAKGVYLGSKDVVEMPQAIVDEYRRQVSMRQEVDRARDQRAAASFHGRRVGA